MTLLTTIEFINYGLVLIYGLFLSVFIAGGWKNRQQRNLIFVLCLCFLALQSLSCLILDVDTVRNLYPLLIHLPLILILIFVLKKRASVSVVSVCTAYLCCQLPRWFKLIITAFTGSPLAGEVSYTLFIIPIFLLLYRLFVKAAHDAITSSPQSLLLFGSLPCAYYLFDYATAVYSDALYVGIQALNEFLPTILIIFYVIFLTAYHAQSQKRAQTELQKSMLEAALKQSASEIENLRHVKMQTLVYQHDMRHHLTAIDGYLSVDKSQQARDYIKKIQEDIEAITPKRFCENELTNLLCSSFSTKARRMDVRLTINAKLPKYLSISDTELCAVLSNGLENALLAAAQLETSSRYVEFYCEVKRNKLLIEIRNPYMDEIAFKDGIPLSSQKNHGHGCRSIRTITEQHQGLCSFEAKNNIFTLRVILPI